MCLPCCETKGDERGVARVQDSSSGEASIATLTRAPDSAPSAAQLPSGAKSGEERGGKQRMLATHSAALELIWPKVLHREAGGRRSGIGGGRLDERVNLARARKHDHRSPVRPIGHSCSNVRGGPSEDCHAVNCPLDGKGVGKVALLEGPTCHATGHRRAGKQPQEGNPSKCRVGAHHFGCGGRPGGLWNRERSASCGLPTRRPLPADMGVTGSRLYLAGRQCQLRRAERLVQALRRPGLPPA